MHDDKPTIYARGKIALEIATRLGLRVFPLKPGTKVPAIADWPTRATTNREQIILWWSQQDFNIGICCGATPRINGSGAGMYYVVAVDYDCKPGQLGLEAHDSHEQLGLNWTIGQKTPHGIHRIFWADRPIPNSQSRLAPNVDIRGHHGYIVGPGSTVEGVDYCWLDDFAEIAPLPEHWYDKICKVSDRESPPQHAPVGELDTPASIERVKSYLINDAPVAHQGSGGDHATFTVAARCKDLGVSEDVCFELMDGHWNEQKADPAWPQEELRTKVRNAYRYGKNPPGSGAPENEFDKVEEPPAPRQGLFRISYRDRVNQAGKTHGDPLIKGLLKRNTFNVMYGPSNSGKTFVATDISFAIGTGALWNGRKTTKGLVVYVAAEGGSGINERTKALDMVRKPTSEPLFDVVPCPIDLLRGSGPDSDTGKLIALIKDAEREHGQPCVLLVIDTLSRALSGGDESSSVDMGTFIKHVDRIRFATGAAILVIHHSGKDIAKGGRGWSGILGAIDTEIELFENTFSNTKQRDLAKIEDIPFQLETVRVGTDEDGDPIYSCVLAWGAAAEFNVELTMAEHRLLDAIVALKLQEFSLSDLRANLAKQKDPMSLWDESVLRERLTMIMMKRGDRLQKIGRGRWVLLPDPDKPTEPTT